MKRYYLIIDHGNTAVKMSLYCDGSPVENTTATALTPQAVADFIARRDIAGIIMASVAGVDSSVATALTALSPKVVEMTPFTPVPIGVDYASQATLGVDRIAAAVAAAAMYPAHDIVVVDAGTAITIDYVDAQGVFRGGNIAPGLNMQLEALHHYTARLPRVEVPDAAASHPALWGDDTTSSILSGCLLSMAGAVDYFRTHVISSATRPEVVVTGGNAPLLLPYLSHCNPVAVPHLVENGLYTILRYNENI